MLCDMRGDLYLNRPRLVAVYQVAQWPDAELLTFTKWHRAN